MNNGWLKKIMKNYDIILRKCLKKIYWRINFGRNIK